MSKGWTGRKRPSVVITCEHGGNEIPALYSAVFLNVQNILATHRGYDIGALEIARMLVEQGSHEFFYSTTSRLLIDLNRSLSNKSIFSKWSKRLSAEVRQRVVMEYYQPYRDRVIEAISTLVERGPVVHLSVHTFTPELNGKVRATEIGILFDPRRPSEADIGRRWKRKLQERLPHRSVHLNLPYRGTSDGFTTDLRTHFPESAYAGIELEVNQKFFDTGPVSNTDAQDTCEAISLSFRNVCERSFASDDYSPNQA